MATVVGSFKNCQEKLIGQVTYNDSRNETIQIRHSGQND